MVPDFVRLSFIAATPLPNQGFPARFLGHLWDRMPATQLYEDLGPTEGYSPSYLIPN